MARLPFAQQEALDLIRAHPGRYVVGSRTELRDGTIHGSVIDALARKGFVRIEVVNGRRAAHPTLNPGYRPIASTATATTPAAKPRNRATATSGSACVVIREDWGFSVSGAQLWLAEVQGTGELLVLADPSRHEINIGDVQPVLFRDRMWIWNRKSAYRHVRWNPPLPRVDKFKEAAQPRRRGLDG